MVPDSSETGLVLGTRESAQLVPIARASTVAPVDVVLIDGYAASRTSVDVGRDLATSGRVRAVVLHALHITPGLVDAARRAGLDGVIGRQVFGPALVDTLIDIATDPPPTTPVIVRSPDHALSGQERDVLLMVGEGWSNREIAESLEIPVSTVRSSVRVLYRKLEVHNRTAVAMIAHRYAASTIERPVVPTAE